ncbi:MAG: PIN domain-containing protein [Candidatus Diapherotrites archaeon]
MRLYLDSNVFISLVREEINGSLNILFKDTELFLSICSKKNFSLLLSYWFFKEIEKSVFLQKEEVVELLKSNYAVLIQEIKRGKGYYLEMKNIARETGIRFGDALHIAIALDSKADLIVSWNKKDFLKARSLINCLNPKEFIEEFT